MNNGSAVPKSTRRLGAVKRGGKALKNTNPSTNKTMALAKNKNVVNRRLSK